MTDKQPDALRLAGHLEAVDKHVLKCGTLEKAATLLRTQHAEIEASNRNLEQLTDEVAQCRKEIERKDALLKQALDALCLPCDCDSLHLSEPVGAAVDAIIKELSK